KGGQIRARLRFAETLAPALGAVDHAGQEALLEFFAAVPAQSVHEIAQARSRRGAGAGQFLVEDDVVDRREVLTTELLRPGQAEEPRRVERAVPFPLPGPVLVAAARVGGRVLGEPGAQPGAEARLGGRITIVHSRSPPGGRETTRPRPAPGADTRAPGSPRCCRCRRAPGRRSRTR